MNIVLSAAKAIALWYLKKHAVDLVVDATLNGLEELAKKTETQIDDDAVSKVRADKEELKAVITKFL